MSISQGGFGIRGEEDERVHERKRKYEAYAALLGPNDRARGLASFPTVDHARARHLSQLVYRSRGDSKGFSLLYVSPVRRGAPESSSKTAPK